MPKIKEKIWNWCDFLKFTPLDYVAHYKTKIVATNGCFELLHLGHVKYLEEARALGDWLVVGINSDDGIKQYKGRLRVPYNEDYRAKMLAALESVSYVVVFPGSKATEFLSILRPSVYVKGGDYTLEKLDSEERKVLQDCGAKIEFIPFVEDYSTTDTLHKIAWING